MTQQLVATQTCAGAVDSIANAAHVIRRLLAAGFSRDQLAVICPAKFKDHFLPEPRRFRRDQRCIGFRS